MSAFPALKTGAVAQYPASKVTTYATQVFHFLDGTDQRFRNYQQAMRRWVIRLELLDDTELAQVMELFESAQGRSGTFSFVDPWDGSVHPNCSFDADELDAMLASEARGRVSVVVRENVN
jgi:hypothetical protein